VDLRVGLVILPTDDWPAAREHFVWAEGAGFATAWTYDHLTWGGMPEGPWHAAFVLLAAAATATERIRLGTLVTSPNFRHPVTLASEVITLDHVCSGRFDLGIGAGSSGPDAVVLGDEPWSPGERQDRFDEFVDLLDELLRHEVTTRRGRWYSAEHALNRPGCTQRPRVPFTVAGGGRRALRTVARQGQRWVTLGATGPGAKTGEGVLAAVTAQCGELEAACAEVGRDPAEIGRVLLVTAIDHGITSLGAFEDLAGPYAELGFEEIVLHHPTQIGPYGGDRATFEAVAARYGAGR